MSKHDRQERQRLQGQRLQIARTAKGWDLQRLATASAVPRRKLETHEAGGGSLTADELVAASAALNMPLWFLFAQH